MTEPSMREGVLRDSFPEIPWDQPLPVVVDGETWFACRYCVAMYGLKASELVADELPYGFSVSAHAAEHIRATHVSE